MVLILIKAQHAKLATEGDGMYAFIPDSGFVGTVFVNALSNLLVTMAKNTKLSLEPVQGATFVAGAIPGGLLHQETSWGIQLNVGCLQYGQPRHFIVPVNLPSDYVHGSPLLQATLDFETRHDAAVPISTSIAVTHQPNVDMRKPTSLCSPFALPLWTKFTKLLPWQQDKVGSVQMRRPSLPHLSAKSRQLGFWMRIAKGCLLM